MFENQSRPQSNPLNPVMPAPGMTPPPPPAGAPTPPAPPRAEVHTMPERFRATGPGPVRSGNKKLVIILIIVAVVAVLVVGALYFFRDMFFPNQNTTNTVVENENIDVINENENVNVDTTNSAVGNANVNTNSNTNAPVNTNTGANSNANTNINVATGGPLPSATDTDQDGLTDTEEAVYGTDSARTDSDGDTFIDGKQVRADGQIVGEVYGGYNPNGAGRLEGSTLAKRQENSAREYSILTPAGWGVVNDASGGMLISPTQQTGEFFQVRINENTNSLTPKQWYESVNPGSSAESLKSVPVNGLEGLISEDESTVYLFKGTKVYSVEYNTGSLNQINYKTTFDMMFRSFQLVTTS